jgi:hypothetical protein
MTLARLAPLAALLVATAASAAPEGASARPALELYVSPDRSFALYKPVGWEVRAQPHPNGRTVVVTAPRGHAFAQMTFLRTDDRGNDSVQLASSTVRGVRARIPGLKIAWVRSTPDRRRTVMEVEYTAPDKMPIRGRQYFIMNHPEARVFGYETEGARFGELQPVFLSVLSNFTFLDAGQWPERASGARAAAPLDLALRSRALSDGSASLLLPPDWQLAGAKGAVLTKSPRGDAGFAFSNADFWGPSSLPYFDSSRIPGAIHAPYMPPVDALMTLMRRFGSSKMQVIERSRDPARAAAAAGALRRRVDAETAVLAFSNDKGLRCKGYYDVLALGPLPSGQWAIIFFAVWAPEAEFDRYLPSLLKIGGSFRINERWASDYIRAGLENLKRLEAKTSRMMAETATAARESLTAAFQERARSEQYLDYKRTSTIRGEQEWVSEVEGGTLYKSDHWGLSREGKPLIEGQPYNYYNYTGQNPRYNESMTPVDASREVYERVYGTPR